MPVGSHDLVPLPFRSPQQRGAPQQRRVERRRGPRRQGAVGAVRRGGELRAGAPQQGACAARDAEVGGWEHADGFGVGLLGADGLGFGTCGRDVWMESMESARNG